MTAIQKYVEIRSKIADLEAELEPIKKEVEELVIESENMNLETQFGEFKMVYVPKWEYSENLTSEEKKIKEKIKLLKRKEEIDGVAQKVTDGGRLVFTKKKE